MLVFLSTKLGIELMLVFATPGIGQFLALSLPLLRKHADVCSRQWNMGGHQPLIWLAKPVRKCFN